MSTSHTAPAGWLFGALGGAVGLFLMGRVMQRSSRFVSQEERPRRSISLIGEHQLLKRLLGRR